MVFDVPVSMRSGHGLVRVETEQAATLRFLDGALSFFKVTTAARPKDLEGSGDTTCGGAAAAPAKTLCPNSEPAPSAPPLGMLQSGAKGAF